MHSEKAFVDVTVPRTGLFGSRGHHYEFSGLEMKKSVLGGTSKWSRKRPPGSSSEIEGEKLRVRESYALLIDCTA